jgi:hypothetical protein
MLRRRGSGDKIRRDGCWGDRAAVCPGAGERKGHL